MAANTDKFKKLTNNFSTTLTAAIVGLTDTSMSLASTTNLPPDTGSVFVIDRINSSGVLTPSVREYVIGVVSGSNVIGLLRGVGNSSAQAHQIGAVVEQVVDQRTINDLVDGILQDHDQSGRHKDLHGTNGNTVHGLTDTASAANNVRSTNATTGNAPMVSAEGADANVDLLLGGKGAGSARWSGYHDGWILANEVPTYMSVSSIGVAAGAKYQAGDQIQLTQSSTIKYFVVSGVTANVLTLIGLSGATVANSAITNFYYSRERSPIGLGLSGGIPFNPYKFSVFINGSYVAPAAPHTIQYSAKSYDTGANFSTSTYKFTCPVAGFYLFSATVANSTNANIFYGIQLIQNGAGISPNIGNIAVQSNNLIYQSMCVSQLIACSVNDVISAQWTGQVGVGNYYVGNGVFSGFLVSAV